MFQGKLVNVWKQWWSNWAITPALLRVVLIQQRSYTLGIVTFGLKYIGPSRTLNGIADKADELGYMLLMKELDNFDTNRIDDVIDSLLARQVDGILWVAPEIGDNHAWIDERLEKIPVPVLFIAMQPRDGISSVATDNFQGGSDGDPASVGLWAEKDRAYFRSAELVGSG